MTFAAAELKKTLDQRGAWVEYSEFGHPPETVSIARGSARSVGTTTPSLVLLSKDPPQAIPLESVRSIQVNDRLIGGAAGLLLGTVSGVLVGAVLGSGAKSSCDPSSDQPCLNMDFSGTILITSTVLGAIIGLAIGAGVGRRTVFVF
jgi:hypothetical protein